jgi:hypothetical protein
VLKLCAAAGLLWCSSFAVILTGHASQPPPAAVAAQHPDFSGIWTTYIAPGQFRGARGRRALDLPLTALAKQKLAVYRSLVGGTSDNAGAHCLGSGMPASMMFSGGYPMEIVQSPEVVLVIYEAWTEIRHFYLGDKIIAVSDRVPDRNGYSTAHWEGDTLVVETTALKEQEDQTYPHSEQARIVERYHLAMGASGAKLLINDWTMTDPLFYTRPLAVQKIWAYDPKGILLPYECNEEAWLDHLDALRKAKSQPGKGGSTAAAAAAYPP